MRRPRGGALLNKLRKIQFFLDRAAHAQEEARYCATATGRSLWLQIAHHYRILAGYAERLWDDGY